MFQTWDTYSVFRRSISQNFEEYLCCNCSVMKRFVSAECRIFFLSVSQQKLAIHLREVTTYSSNSEVYFLWKHCSRCLWLKLSLQKLNPETGVWHKFCNHLCRHFLRLLCIKKSNFFADLGTSHWPCSIDDSKWRIFAKENNTFTTFEEVRFII